MEKYVSPAAQQMRDEQEAARKKRQPFSVGDRVRVHNHFEPDLPTLGYGNVIGVDKMGQNYYSVQWKSLPRVKKFYPMAGRDPGMYCSKPCIQVTCEEGCDLSLVE